MTAALKIEKLKKTFENGFEALQGIDLTVEEGDFFALLGPNGAGKSTIIGVICSLIRKTEGRIQVFDADVDVNFPRAKKYIGIVPQEFNFNTFEKVFHIVVTQAGYYGLPKKLAEERAEKYLKQLGLWEKRWEQARTLSGGMKRRLMIARALVHEPKLLILDEPTAGVDIELRRSMWDFLQKINAAGTTIILTTHYLEEAESLCEKIAIIDHGRIIRNTSVKALLRELNKETFLFDLRDEMQEAPELPGYKTRLVDDHCLQVEVDKNKPMNALFQLMDQRGLQIQSMRNKANRLEEMFVSMLAQNGGNDQ